VFLFADAPGAGLEPATISLHIIQYFHIGVDYIFTYLKDLGALVSSLYGALRLRSGQAPNKEKGSHGITFTASPLSQRVST